MTAHEARELTDKTSLDGIADVYTSIENAAMQGEYKAYFYASLKYAVLETLRADGFQVTDATDKDGSVYIISWDRPRKSFQEKVNEVLCKNQS